MIDTSTLPSGFAISRVCYEADHEGCDAGECVCVCHGLASPPARPSLGEERKGAHAPADIGPLAVWRGLARTAAESWHPSVADSGRLPALRRAEAQLEQAVRGHLRAQADWLDTHLDLIVLDPTQLDALDWTPWPQRFLDAVRPSVERVMALSGEAAKEEVAGYVPPKRTAEPDPGLALGWTVNSPEAQEWITSWGLDLAKGLDDTTTDSLRRIILGGIKEGKGIPDIRKRIGAAFLDMTTWRARMIAQTETVRAYSQGALQVYGVAGVEEKRWLDGQLGAESNGVDGCRDLNGKQTGLKDEFADGVDAPPRHPGCRCAVRAVVS